MRSEWAHAFVAVGMFNTTPDKFAVNKRLPVVIHLHGAIGIDPERDVLWGFFIRELG